MVHRDRDRADPRANQKGDDDVVDAEFEDVKK